MKIKVKDEADNIILKCKHKDLILFSLALELLQDVITEDILEYVNSFVFDKDEFESFDELLQYIGKNNKKLYKTIKNIKVF